MNTGIRWLKVVLHIGVQTMIASPTSLLLGATNSFNTDTDALHPNTRGTDVVGSPILFVDDDVLAAFDRTVEPSDGIVEDVEASFDGSNESDGEDPDDGEDEDDIDWSEPMFVHGHRGQVDESSRELRVEAFDAERAMQCGFLGPGCAAPSGAIEMLRQRDPVETGDVNLYVL